MEVLKERSGGLLSSHILKFPVVLLETMLKEVDPKLLTFPFHLKTGTDVFTPYPEETSFSSRIDTAVFLHADRLHRTSSQRPQPEQSLDPCGLLKGHPV